MFTIKYTKHILSIIINNNNIAPRVPFKDSLSPPKITPIKIQDIYTKNSIPNNSYVIIFPPHPLPMMFQFLTTSIFYQLYLIIHHLHL